MTTSSEQRRSPLGLFPDKPAPRLYDRMVEVLRVRHYARRPKRLPVVLTVDEVSRVLTHLAGDKWLVAMLLYGGGLRLLEALRLRVKDLDFERAEITVREGKGDKDRVMTLPQAIVHLLQEHLERVKAIHQQDVANGYGRVELPHALARKYPNANREWAWQFVCLYSPKSIAGSMRRPATKGDITFTNLSYRRPSSRLFDKLG